MALGGVVLWPLFMLFAGVLMAVTPLLPSNGANEPHLSGPVVQQALLWRRFWASYCTSAVTKHRLFGLFEIDPEAVDVARQYLQGAAWGLPAVCSMSRFAIPSRG